MTEVIPVFVLFILQRKDFPSNSFYVVVVVKTEDQACGGSLPYYPFVEGMFHALCRDGSGSVALKEAQEPPWLLVDPMRCEFGALDSLRPGSTNPG